MAESELNDNFIMENGTVEVVYVEMGNGNDILTDTQSSSVKRKPIKPRSIIYQFFSWEEQTKEWSCNICKKMYSPSIAGGTGSLTNHMKREHLQVYENAKKNDVGRKTQTIPLSDQKSGPREITKEIFRQKLIEFIVCTDQAFTLVEDPSFRDLIDYCSGGNAECELFSAKTAKTRITDLYKEKKANLSSVLQSNEGKISYIVDCWTSSNQFPFQGVVAKWISADWQMCSTVVDLTILQGSHKGKFIAKAFWDVLKDYGVCHKLCGITGDNASNMDTMCEELEVIALGDDIVFDSKNYRARCFAHIMNLSCQDMINSVGDGGPDAYSSDIETDDEEEHNTEKELPVVTKLRRGVVAIRRSPQRRELFVRQCVAAKIEAKMVLRDVRTRWNATLTMCERAKELKEPFDLTLRSIPKLRKYVLDDDDWCKITELIKILSPFREATVMLSNEHSPTMSRVISVYQVLFDHLEKYKKNEINISEPGPSKRKKNNSQEATVYPEWLIHAAERGLNKLEKYYPSTDGLVYIVATVLDPRYKLTWYRAVGWPKDWIDFCRKSVTELYKTQYKPQTQIKQTEPTDSNDTRQPYYLFDDLFNSQMKNHVKSYADDELKKYLNEGVVDPDLLLKEKTGIDGALGWWKIHSKEYPNLSKMAKDFLPVSGTGVPVERLFSSGPDLLSPRRQAMAPETIKMCMCLKAWLKNKKLFEEDIREAISYKLGANTIESDM